MYCPECGQDHHVADRALEAAADREVTLAKIEADKEIKIAQINASVARELTETENAITTAHAEGIAEGMQTVVDAATGDGQAAELAPDGAPIVVEAPPAPVAEPEPELAPPIVETSPSSPSSSRGSGWVIGRG